MRRSFVLTFALLASSTGNALVAQGDEVNPRLLVQQIALQQRLVQTPAGEASGDAWLKLAVLLQDDAQYGESEHAYGKALRLLTPRGPAVAADVMDHLGTMYVESGQMAKAEPLEREALRMREAEKDAVGIGVSHMHLGALLLRKGEIESAEGEARVAVNALLPELSGAVTNSAVTPEQKMTALINLSLIRCQRSACAGSIPFLRSALAIAQKNYSDDSFSVGYVEFLIGYANWKSGDLQQAAQFMKVGTGALAASVGWGHPVYLRALSQYRTVLSEAGSTAEAREVDSQIQRLHNKTLLAHADARP